MTFVDYIIKERSRRFLSISLMDMEKCNYKGTLEEWFGFTKEQEMGSLLNESKIPKYRNELTKEQLEILTQQEGLG